MGSSKKHKSDKDRDGHREHKRKRRHKSRSVERDAEAGGGGRSRSRSPSASHKERKHRREEKKRRREKEYLEELRSSVKASVEHQRSQAKPLKDEPEDGEIPEPSVPPGVKAATGGGGDLSLTIDATNKLRAELGLKPLDVGPIPGMGGTGEDSKLGDDVHAPPTNLADIKRQEDLREKMALIREKRKINQKLGKVKTLGESDSDEEGALAWVNKNRKLVKERELADKRAKLLAEMDEEFGVGELVEEEFGAPKKPQYTSSQLKGLSVEHSVSKFKEGQNVILTLKDSGVLDQAGDVLINVNMIDDLKAEKNVELKKLKKDYNPYDDEEEDGFGYVDKDVLEKYNEKMEEKFELGKGGRYDAEHERQMAMFKQQYIQKGEALSLPAPRLATEYYTASEMEGFKKVKKKVRKIRKKPKILRADDLEPIEESYHHERKRRERDYETDVPKELIEKQADIPGLDLVDMEVDEPEPIHELEILGPEMDLTGVTVDDDAANELDMALNKARKLKQKREKPTPNTEQVVASRVKALNKLKHEEGAEMPLVVGVNVANSAAAAAGGPNIILNSTSEFCRTLGDIPTYGQAGNREEDEDDLADFENDMADKHNQGNEDDDGGTGWQSVEIDTRPVDIKDEDHVAIEEEPTIDAGIVGALQLANKKGFLEQENLRKGSAPKHTILQAQHYSIEDKRYDDLDEKYRKRDRYHTGGMTMEFRDLDKYKPDVKLEYVDETGRILCPKEAFRQLSHRFHGKGSGKKKTEKRSKKHEQDQLLKTASSTDTPLGTVALLQEKQRAEKTPFIVLSGSNKGLTAATISKQT